MPHSDRATHPFMLDAIANLIPTKGKQRKITVLDCGVGAGGVGKSLRDRFGDKLVITGLEVFSPYINDPKTIAEVGENWHKSYDTIIHGDQANFALYLPKSKAGSFDFVIFGDSLEHVIPEFAEHSLHYAIKVAKLGVIVNIPIVYYPQEAVHNNPWEAHRSQWDIPKVEAFGGVFQGGNDYVGCFLWDKKTFDKDKYYIRTINEIRKNQ